MPEWMTHEIEQALNAIDGATGYVRRKKRTTVLRVAQAQATGQPLTTVWAQPDCGSKNAWYGETRRGVLKPGWCDEPAVQEALRKALARADWYVDVHLGRAIGKATDKLVEAAPAAAEQLARMATLGVMLVRRNERVSEEPVNAPEVIKAINSVLDRADARTASKLPASVEHKLAPELQAALERAYGDVPADNADSQRDET